MTKLLVIRYRLIVVDCALASRTLAMERRADRLRKVSRAGSYFAKMAGCKHLVFLDEMPVDKRAIQERVAAHVRRNAVLVEQIKSRGGDLERERPIDVFFHARTEDTAINLSRFLKSEGFREISISRSHDEDDYPWTVQASIARSISTFTSRGLVEYFVGLASGFGVIYDGWGTALDETPPTL